MEVPVDVGRRNDDGLALVTRERLQTVDVVGVFRVRLRHLDCA